MFFMASWAFFRYIRRVPLGFSSVGKSADGTPFPAGCCNYECIESPTAGVLAEVVSAELFTFEFVVLLLKLLPSVVLGDGTFAFYFVVFAYEFAAGMFDCEAYALDYCRPAEGGSE